MNDLANAAIDWQLGNDRKPVHNRASGRYSIGIGIGVVVENDFEFALGGWEGFPIRRTRLSQEELAVLSDILIRMVADRPQTTQPPKYVIG